MYLSFLVLLSDFYFFPPKNKKNKKIKIKNSVHLKCTHFYFFQKSEKTIQKMQNIIQHYFYSCLFWKIHFKHFKNK